MSKNLYFPGYEKLSLKEVGGSLLNGVNPREQRPISVKRPMHLVMRSCHAQGTCSLLRSEFAGRVARLVQRLGKAKGVRIYRFANSGNHVHLILLPRSRQAFQAFIRALSGLITRLVLKSERGKPADLSKFWDARPYTRIVEWGREFKAVTAYVLQNTLEALGFIPYQPRSERSCKGGKGRAKTPAQQTWRTN